MPNTRSVKEALKCLSAAYRNEACGNCAYFRPFTDDPDTGWCDKRQVATDALRLIEQHDARLLSLEELKTYTDPVYLEEDPFVGFGSFFSWAMCIVDKNTMYATIRNGVTHNYDTKKYGNTWRCWTAKPTASQQQTKWEE